jgi:hypothetical protein
MTMRDSDTQDYETAIATFRRVLGGVSPEQITSATPCASFDVGQLVDHTIGTQHMVTDALQDKPFNTGASRSLAASKPLLSIEQRSTPSPSSAETAHWTRT